MLAREHESGLYLFRNRHLLSTQPILPISLGHYEPLPPMPSRRAPRAQGSTASPASPTLDPSGQQQHQRERWARNSPEASCPSLSGPLTGQEHRCHLKTSNRKHEVEPHRAQCKKIREGTTPLWAAEGAKGTSPEDQDLSSGSSTEQTKKSPEVRWETGRGSKTEAKAVPETETQLERHSSTWTSSNMKMVKRKKSLKSE